MNGFTEFRGRDARASFATNALIYLIVVMTGQVFAAQLAKSRRFVFVYSSRSYCGEFGAISIVAGRKRMVDHQGIQPMNLTSCRAGAARIGEISGEAS